MKKTIFLIAFTSLTSTWAYTQINRPAVIKKKTEPVKTAPAQTPPPPPPSLVYSLTSARVSIRTGNDNKEFPSGIYVDIWQKGHPGWYYQEYCLFNISNLKNEMAVNSTTDLGLEKYAGSADKFLLTTIQKNGLELNVSYNPNFFMDAWKIENITWTLEFRDQNGNLHPNMGNKIISFSNATGFLNNEYHRMRCTTDQNLNPLTAAIEK
ncbi:MAG: hypothetical protein JNN00_08340 [Chitinophagaceae bacterium]|nr:hypothetical protein [Chitinophagaceae bacterium]